MDAFVEIVLDFEDSYIPDVPAHLPLFLVNDRKKDLLHCYWTVEFKTMSGIDLVRKNSLNKQENVERVRLITKSSRIKNLENTVFNKDK